MAWNRATTFRLDALPTEIADMILKMLDNSRDIQNVFTVFPSLIDRVKWEKQEWLIDQVAPLLFPYLTKKKLFKSRLMSKRWARGFDQFLENCQPNGRHNGLTHASQQLHPSRAASRAQAKLRAQLATFSFQHSFNSTEKFHQLLGSMGKHPPCRNPFIGRKISLFNGELDAENRDQFWNRASSFLYNFGKHVWYHDVVFDANGNYDNACRHLIESLACLPNLREVAIRMPKSFGFVRQDEAFLESFLGMIPLPRLETLNLHNPPGQPSSSPIFEMLIRRCASQIRKLRISYSNLRVEYSHMFPELRELTLLQENSRMEDVISALASLRAPELRRLELHIGMDRRNVEDFGRGIALWLEPFRKLISVKVVAELRFLIAFWRAEKVNKNLSFCYERKALGWTGKKKVAPLPVSIPSLKSLSIELCQNELCELINFDFLQCFPNLEYLDINCLNFKRILYFRNMGGYNAKIWEGMLLKLKELNLTHDGSSKCFTRARYEWIQRRQLANLTAVANALVMFVFMVVPILIGGYDN